MVRSLGLDQLINDRLFLLKRHLPYHESDHVLNLAYNVMTGGMRLGDLDRLREDESYLDLVGAQRTPDPTTAGDYLRRFKTQEKVLVLMDAINAIRRTKVWSKLPSSERKLGIIDGDGSYVTTTGQKKYGMEVNYKGDWGYHPLVVSLANTQEPLYVVNRKGNVPSHEGATEWFDRAIEQCRGTFEQIMLRGDTDFSLTRNFDRWTESGVKFVFGYDAKKQLVKRALRVKESKWKPLERSSGGPPRTGPRLRRENVKEGIVIEREFKNIRLCSEWVGEIPYRPRKCKGMYRLIMLRKDLSVERGEKVLFPDVRYFFYITNDKDLSPAGVVAHANARCNQENLLDQMKNGVGALRVPVHDLVGNWAYMVIASLAWTLKSWFGQLQPREADRTSIVRMEFPKFLHSVIRVVCQVVRGGHRTRVRILSYTPHARLLLLDVGRLARPGP
jgi:hypothetical protein